MSETLSIFEKHAGARCALFSRDSQTGVQTRLRVMGIFKKTKASILSASQCLLHIDTSPQRPVNNVDHVLPASQATSKNQHTYCLKSQSNCKRGNAAMQKSERRPEMNEVQSSHHRPIPWPRGENTRQRMTQKNEQEKNTARKSIVASCCFIFLSLLYALYPSMRRWSLMLPSHSCPRHDSKESSHILRPFAKNSSSSSSCTVRICRGSSWHECWQRLVVLRVLLKAVHPLVTLWTRRFMTNLTLMLCAMCSRWERGEFCKIIMYHYIIMFFTQSNQCKLHFLIYQSVEFRLSSFAPGPLGLRWPSAPRRLDLPVPPTIQIIDCVTFLNLRRTLRYIQCIWFQSFVWNLTESRIFDIPTNFLHVTAPCNESRLVLWKGWVPTCCTNGCKTHIATLKPLKVQQATTTTGTSSSSSSNSALQKSTWCAAHRRPYGFQCHGSLVATPHVLIHQVFHHPTPSDL